ncbi:hypothetical protein EV642_121105 [Kribbella sp. VKM Ac-2500]|nr:hypothetical protein EV642_121105 [Kribbella sp. VKM Ac-2500]
MTDEPGADLESAAAEAIAHLQAAQAALAPFFWQQFAVGDVVDVVRVAKALAKSGPSSKRSLSSKSAATHQCTMPSSSRMRTA